MMKAEGAAKITGRVPGAHRVATGCTLIAIVVASLALAGWASGSAALRSLGQSVAMNPLVAVLVIACGAALLLNRSGDVHRWRRVIVGLLASAAVAAAASRLIGYAANLPIGFDTLLFRSSLAENQMAPNTCLCLLLLGGSIIALLFQSQSIRRGSGFLALAAAVIAAVSLVGYFVSVLSLYQLGPHVPMALNTAAAMLALGVAALLAQPEASPISRFLRSWTIERTIAGGFAGALLMLCLVSVISIQSTHNLVSRNESAEAAFNELLQLTDVVSHLKDAETGQRGYLLTGEKPYLRPYLDALARLEADLEALRQSTDANPEQRERLSRIEPLIRRKLAELERTITLRNERGYEAALEVVKTDQGRQLMEEVKRVLADMRSQGESSVKARSADAVVGARRTTTVTGVGCSFMLLVVLVAGLLVRRGLVARRAAERAMREADERLRLLVDSVEDYAIVMLDPEGRVASWNNGAERIKGYAADEIIGEHFSRFYPPGDQDKPARELDIAARTGRHEDEGWRVRKDGSQFWANVALCAVREQGGEIRGFAKVTRDVTERKRNEDQIRKLNDNLRQHGLRLETANKELEAFSYSVSHDLRAPLRSIDGFSLALMEDYASKLEPEARDYLQRVRAATKRMAQLIDDLLALSRVSRSDMTRTKVDLSGLARNVAAELRNAQPDRQTEFMIADGLTADADPRLLRIVLDNLFGNAWKFTSKHPNARIEFGTSGENGSRQFFVRDNGAGFDMTYAHKLFGAFQRLHANEEFAGTGIGLATVQRIINRHGGRITAEGAVGQGATFRFSL
jgi:PAS domain S-box-containing protein